MFRAAKWKVCQVVHAAALRSRVGQLNASSSVNRWNVQFCAWTPLQRRDTLIWREPPSRSTLLSSGVCYSYLSSLVQTICPPQAFCLRLHTLIPPDSFIPLHTSCRYLQATVRHCCQVESVTQTRVICPPRAFRLLGVVPIFSSLVPNTVELTETRLSSAHMCQIQLWHLNFGWFGCQIGW